MFERLIFGCRKLAAMAVLPAAAFSVALSVGCTDLTGRGAAPLDKTLVGNIEQHSRLGHVYCMRGWLGIFSTGMDELARKIDQDLGVAAVSVANEEHYRLREYLVEKYKEGRIKEPLVLVGHSYGADDQIRVAQTLQQHGIGVELMVLFDPVTPPKVPANVKRVYNIYRSRPLTDMYPWWRGVLVEVADPIATECVNIDLRTTDVGFDSEVHHALIDKVPGIHAMAIKEIERVCKPRPGVAQKPPMTLPAVAPANGPGAMPAVSPTVRSTALPRAGASVVPH